MIELPTMGKLKTSRTRIPFIRSFPCCCPFGQPDGGYWPPRSWYSLSSSRRHRRRSRCACSARAGAVTAQEIDQAIIAEIKSHSEIMKNLQYLSDMIGGRLTGSKNLERANNWTAEKMKSYGLENVRLEPWEIPVGWERGKAR